MGWEEPMPFDGLLPDENPAMRVINLMIDAFIILACPA